MTFSEKSRKSELPVSSGIALRPIHFHHTMETRPDVPWFEVVTESLLPLGAFHAAGRSLSPRAERLESRALETITRVRENYPLALHGISLSVGSTDPLNEAYLTLLNHLSDRLEPLWVSDHLCWTGAGSENLHDLMPLPFTRETLEHVIPRVHHVQERLKRPILLENISSYLTFRHSEMREWEFHAEIMKRTGCGMLLDVNDVHVTATNHGWDARHYIDGLPAGAVGYYHLGGNADAGSYLLNSRSGPVNEEVWKLFGYAVERLGDAPAAVEWDEDLPVFSELQAQASEADRIRAEIKSGRNSRIARKTDHAAETDPNTRLEPPSFPRGTPEMVQ